MTEVLSIIGEALPFTGERSIGTYGISISVPDEDLVNMIVKPEMLTFSHIGGKQTFTVTMEISQQTLKETLGFTKSYGKLELTDGTQTVGSSMGFIRA
jgi:hypothetical protein